MSIEPVPVLCTTWVPVPVLKNLTPYPPVEMPERDMADPLVLAEVMVKSAAKVKAEGPSVCAAMEI